MTTRKRAVLFARWSNEDKEGRIKSQLSVDRIYAESKNYEIVDEIIDDGEKGESLTDPGISKALEMAQAGLYDILVVRRVDRFTRNAVNAVMVEAKLYKYGVVVEYVEDSSLNNLPQDDPMTDVMKFWQFRMAQEDKKKTVKKFYLSRVDRIRDYNSVMTCSRPPYGYNQIEEIIQERNKQIKVFSLEINEDEARWVRQVYHWYVILLANPNCVDFDFEIKDFEPKITWKPQNSHRQNSSPTVSYVFDNLSFRDIQRKLTEARVPRPSEAKKITGGNTKNKDGVFTWPHNSVKEILKRKVYTGIYEYGKTRRNKRKESLIKDILIQEPITVEVPAIISQELFDAAQVKIQTNRKKTIKTTKYKFLFRSRVVCGECDGLVCRCQADNRNSWRAYRCATKVKGKKDPANFRTCNLPSFKRDKVDNDVWQWLRNTFDDKKGLKLGYENFKKNKGNKLRPLIDELARIESKIEECNQTLLEQATALGRLQAIDSTHAVTAIQEQIKKTEAMIDDYNKAKAEVTLKLEKAKTAKEIITDFDGFVDRIREGIRQAEGNFERMLYIVNKLDVQVILFRDENGPQFTARCILRPDNNEPISSITPRFG